MYTTVKIGIDDEGYTSPPRSEHSVHKIHRGYHYDALFYPFPRRDQSPAGARVMQSQSPQDQAHFSNLGA